MKNKLIFFLIWLIVLLIALYVFASLKECRITDKQQEILNYEVPLNATAREQMIRGIEQDMKPLDYFCINNPRQLLIRKFYDVSLK